MILDEGKYSEAREVSLKQGESIFEIERKIEAGIHLIGLAIVICTTQYYYPSVTTPIVLAWIGISINSKLIAVYYIIKIVGNTHTSYLEELRKTGREFLSKKED